MTSKAPATTHAEEITIVLADDHKVVLQGLPATTRTVGLTGMRERDHA